MRMESVDITDQNIDKIASLFPSCITEAKDENGKLKLIYSNNEIGGFAFHLTQKN